MSPTATKPAPTVAFNHPDCGKNRVEAEPRQRLLAQVGEGGSFVRNARQQSLRTPAGRTGQGLELMITRCLALHSQEELLESIPEAEVIIASGDHLHIAEMLQRAATCKWGSLLSTLDIDPKLHGNRRSHLIGSIEAGEHLLAELGGQKLMLISNDHELDDHRKPMLAELIRALGEVEIHWFRHLHTHPTGLSRNELGADRDVATVEHLDLALRAVIRPGPTDVNAQWTERIREQLPGAIPRITLIVGIPWEDEEDCKHLMAFPKRHCFDPEDVFTSPVEFGPAAAELPDHDDPGPAVAQSTKDVLMTLQRQISEERDLHRVSHAGDLLNKHHQHNPSSGAAERRVQPMENGQQVLQGSMTPLQVTGAEIDDLSGRFIAAGAMVASFRADA